MAEIDTLRIELLGAFRVEAGARHVPAADWRRKPRHLISLLALASDHRLHREQIVDALWPDSEPAEAGNILHRTLYTARRTLEPALTPSRPSAYLQLRADVLTLTAPRRLWIDVDAFTAAATLARRARTPTAYQAALDHYGGELLPDDRYDDWAAGRREELRDLYLALLLEAARLHEERGGLEAAVQALSTAIAQDAACEEAHAGLMRLYALQGQLDAALRQYDRLCDALRRELDAAPAAASRRLRDDIAAGHVPAASSAPAAPALLPVADAWPATVPAPTTSFIGRERELSMVIGLLSTTRLLTLTGAGGTGKTRLALHVAAALRHAYADGVRAVELAAVGDATLVSQAVATALEVREEPGRPLMATLVEALQERRVLLVLDNCEHLRGACAELAAELLRGCPALGLLATSREPLGLGAELAWPVPALALPEPEQSVTAERLEEYDAICLFLERARAARPAFALTEDNAPAVAQLCRRLDGLPLAIELAAARVTVLTPQEMTARLADLFALLPGQRDPHLPHHRTLRAAIDWSHELLSDWERVLFRRLAVFAGGWTVEAAEAVCAGGGLARGAILDLLARLVEQSLVVAREQGALMRFRLLEAIRQYAAEKLEQAGEAAAVRQRHAEWCLELVEQADPTLYGPRQAAWVRRIMEEHDNIRAALWKVIRHGEREMALRFGAMLWSFWYQQGYIGEGRDWLDRILAQTGHLPAPAQPLLARTLTAAGNIEHIVGHNRGAIERYEEALAVWRALGDQRGIAGVLSNLASPVYYDGHVARAIAYYEEALQISRELGTDDRTAVALNGLGSIAEAQGDYEQALASYDESRALFRRLGDRRPEAGLSINIASVQCMRGDYGQAAATALESLSVLREMEDLPGQINCLELLGGIAWRRGDLAQARAYYDEELTLSNTAGDRWSSALALHGLGRLAHLQGDDARALALYQQSLQLQRDLHYKQGSAAVLTDLAAAALTQGDQSRAMALYAESLALYMESGAKPGIITCLEGSAEVARVRGCYEPAARLLAAAAAWRGRLGAVLPPCDRPAIDRCVAAVHEALGSSAMLRAKAAGSADTLEQAAKAAAEVLRLDRPFSAPTPVPGGRATSLTPREREIATLIAAGQTNRQIAAATGIALRTVDTHVGKILGKLGASTRAEVAALSEAGGHDAADAQSPSRTAVIRRRLARSPGSAPSVTAAPTHQIDS